MMPKQLAFHEDARQRLTRGIQRQSPIATASLRRLTEDAPDDIPAEAARTHRRAGIGVLGRRLVRPAL